MGRDVRWRLIILVSIYAGAILMIIGRELEIGAVAEIGTLVVIGPLVVGGCLWLADCTKWLSAGGAYRLVRRAGEVWRRLQREWRG